MPARQPVYLDYASATPVDSAVLKAMAPYWSNKFHNPSSPTLAGQATRRAIESARHTVAKCLGAKPHQIVFTSGATEANNLAITGRQAWLDGRILVSAIEHESVLEPARLGQHGVIPVSARGEVDLGRLEKLVNDEVALVSVVHASNEIGTIQPLNQIARLVKSVRADRARRGVKRPLWLHSDAAQSPTTLDLHVDRLGVDLLTLSAAKIYGPKGIGCLYVRERHQLQPNLRGGGQEWGLRSGTEPVGLIVGFAAALERAVANRAAAVASLEALRQVVLKELATHQPDISLNGESAHRLSHLVSLHVPGADGEALVMALDQAGFEVATGAACAASSDAPSHVLTAIGLTAQQANASLRLSWSTQTSAAALKSFVRTLGQRRRALDSVDPKP